MNKKNNTLDDMVIFADSKDLSKSSIFSNTYIFNHNDRHYIVDASCGKKRAVFFDYSNKQTLPFSEGFSGWKITEGLYAVETPGQHSSF